VEERLMAEFNVLTESFITNEDPLISGTSIDLNAEQIAELISESGSSVTISGGILSILMDLGAQKSIDRLDYGFTPASTSGLTIKYGRDLSNLTNGVMSQVGQGVRVEPTISGFTYPRYFRIDHEVPSGTPITLTSLEVINNDEEVNFGEDGNLESFNLTGGAFAGTSQVYELNIKNDGTIPTDMFVSADTSDVDYDLLKRLELAPTPTGTFISFDEDLSIPSSIPWEWGAFENCTVNSENQLSVSNPDNNLANLKEGDEVSLSESRNDSTDSIGSEAIDANGVRSFIRTRNNHRIYFMDVARNIRTASSLPLNSPADSNEQNFTCLAWDESEYIYYLNGKDTKEIQRYHIPTDTHSVFVTGVPYFSRKCKVMFYDAGYLYIFGAVTSTTSSADVGFKAYKVNISTQVATPIENVAETVDDALNGFCKLNGYIYFLAGPNNGNRFHRYHIASDTWQTLANHPGTFVSGITGNTDTNKILACFDNQYIYEYDTSLGNWSSTYVKDLDPPAFIDYNDIVLGFNNTLLFATQGSDDSYQRAFILDTVTLDESDTEILGTWLSPVMRVEDAENFRRVYVNTLENAGSVLKFDESLGSETFEIRGSDSQPASDNIVEEFGTILDPDVWVQGVFNNTIITSDNNVLNFSYQGDVDTYNSGYVTFGLPLGTSSKMQYKFWWSPASDRLSGSTHYSRFYIVPFIETLETGVLPNRDLDTAERSDDNFISLIFGDSSDSGGVISALKVYNGSSTTNYSISASAGTYYEVVWIIDWDTGEYSLYFDGNQLESSGTIPGFRREVLQSQHTFEVFSATEEVDADEKFKYLTVNRVGLDTSSNTDKAIPVHAEDPLYGLNGSLEFFPMTVNSPLVPKTEFVQLRLTIRTTNLRPEDSAIVSSVEFPPVILLEDVGVGESKPVYFRYTFDSANNLSTDLLSLKAWMFTDKL
jgi:hypothetical protein